MNAADHGDMVRMLAATAVKRLGVRCDFDDLVGFGFEGLLQAQRSFDANRGVPFQAFARQRVYGAIVDGVRSMSLLTRSAHKRTAEPSEVDFARRAAAAAVAGGDETMSAPTNCDPEAALLEGEMRALVSAAAQQLSGVERQLIEGHYFNGRPFNEIACELGLSKSWASRLHARALSRMKNGFHEAENRLKREQKPARGPKTGDMKLYYRLRYLALRERGLCTCGKPARAGKATCGRHGYTRQQAAAYRQRNKERGVCQQHPRRPVESGTTRCFECGVEQREISHRKRAARRAAGLCRNCGMHPTSTALCERCKAQRREAKRARRSVMTTSNQVEQAA